MEVETPQPVSASSSGIQTEKRIAWLNFIFGAIATIAALLLRQQRWAIGLAIGAALAWLNFRLLGRGLDTLVLQSIAQRERKKVQVPLTSYLGIAFRYALIGLAVYVIFVYLHVPLVSLILGLCTLAAAAITASVWEILQPGPEQL